MVNQELTDAQWSYIEPFVPGGRKGKRGPRSNNRRFINALIWMARSGGRWRDLPERYGNVHTTKTRYYRWIKACVLERIVQALSDGVDLEWVSVDSTSVRAHAQAATARQKKGVLKPNVLVNHAGG